MKKTNYSKVAQKYDSNTYRHEIKPDEDLKNSLDAFNESKFKVLDLACGTGLFLEKQSHSLRSEKIDWYGLDASEEMLAKAKEKVPDALLVKGFAEQLPYSENYFDFIINNYAFHHFNEKSKAMDEIYRVLNKGGIFKMHNIAIHEMTKWWIYQYFPSAYYEDLKRFWQKDLIFKELTTRGFDVEVKIDYVLKEEKISQLIDFARNRDISILTLINDDEYRKGLEKMEYELKKDSETKITVNFADLFVIAKKA